MLLRKIKSLQIFSDGSLNYYNSNLLKMTKKYNFCKKDFKNSKFCDKKGQLFLQTTADSDNVEYRYKFLKV